MLHKITPKQYYKATFGINIRHIKVWVAGLSFGVLQLWKRGCGMIFIHTIERDQKWKPSQSHQVSSLLRLKNIFFFLFLYLTINKYNSQNIFIIHNLFLYFRSILYKQHLVKLFCTVLIHVSKFGMCPALEWSGIQ